MRVVAIAVFRHINSPSAPAVRRHYRGFCYRPSVVRPVSHRLPAAISNQCHPVPTGCSCHQSKELGPRSTPLMQIDGANVGLASLPDVSVPSGSRIDTPPYTQPGRGPKWLSSQPVFRRTNLLASYAATLPSCSLSLSRVPVSPSRGNHATVARIYAGTTHHLQIGAVTPGCLRRARRQRWNIYIPIVTSSWNPALPVITGPPVHCWPFRSASAQHPLPGVVITSSPDCWCERRCRRSSPQNLTSDFSPHGLIIF